MNKIIFNGNLGKDSELIFAAGTGKAVLKWSVAVKKGYKKDDGVNWFNCVMFGERGEKLAQYLVKGTKVIVEGSLQLGSYEGNDGTKKYTTDIFVNDVELDGNKKDNSVTTSQENKDISEITPIDDGDIPF